MIPLRIDKANLPSLNGQVIIVTSNSFLHIIQHRAIHTHISQAELKELVKAPPLYCTHLAPQ